MFYIKKQGQSHIHVTALAAHYSFSSQEVRILIIKTIRMHHQLPLAFALK